MKTDINIGVPGEFGTVVTKVECVGRAGADDIRVACGTRPVKRKSPAELFLIRLGKRIDSMKSEIGRYHRGSVLESLSCWVAEKQRDYRSRRYIKKQQLKK